MAPVVALKPLDRFTAGEAGWRQPAPPRHPAGQVYTFPAGAPKRPAARTTPQARAWPPAVSVAFIVGVSAGLWGLVVVAIAALV